MFRHTTPEPQRFVPRGADVCAHVWHLGSTLIPTYALERGSKGSTG
jgi:hypothetical protein